ncbi:MAG: transposase [Anaerolineales bacterium]
MTKVKRSGLKCFNSFLKTLTNWLNRIANYFSDRLSSGFVEGLNNKIKTLKRRCYGLRIPGHIFQRLYLDLEGYRCLPDPPPYMALPRQFPKSLNPLCTVLGWQQVPLCPAQAAWGHGRW